MTFGLASARPMCSPTLTLFDTILALFTVMDIASAIQSSVAFSVSGLDRRCINPGVSICSMHHCAAHSIGPPVMRTIMMLLMTIPPMTVPMMAFPGLPICRIILPMIGRNPDLVSRSINELNTRPSPHVDTFP